MKQAAKYILIVDDNKDGADSLAKLLGHFNFEVDVAYDGPEALDLLQNKTPDAIILDIGLPGMDGYEVAKRVRKHYLEKGRKLLLIALSGYGQDDDKKRSIEAGCDEHFIKPIDVRRLESFIKSTPPT